MLWTVQHALFFVSLGRESAMVGKCKYMSTVCVCGGVWCVCVCLCVCVPSRCQIRTAYSMGEVQRFQVLLVTSSSRR